MGGLWRKIPFTYAMMVIGTLALTGFPFTAGLGAGPLHPAEPRSARSS
jgi:NADH:ubiquinone oxidoreductase subunit 5 (subunit L)/multisubunit Na+/H+ antiporter MnhA subunit